VTADASGKQLLVKLGCGFIVLVVVLVLKAIFG
jgi:hypothetical protein